MRSKVLMGLLAALLLSGNAEAQSCNGCGIGFWMNGVPASGGTFTGPILLPNGSAAAPALSYANGTTCGSYFSPTGDLFFACPDTIRFQTNGVTRHMMTSGGEFRMSAANTIGWSSNAIASAAVADTILVRDAANTLAQKNGNSDQFNRLYGANGGYWERGVNSELLTIAAAATTDTTGNLLPANAVIEAVVVRVTTIIPTAATFTVGDATTAARFATGVAVAADTTAVGLSHRQPDVAAAAGPVQTSAAKVRITPNTSPGAATGVVRIEVFFSRFVPPTS